MGGAPGGGGPPMGAEGDIPPEIAAMMEQAAAGAPVGMAASPQDSLAAGGQTPLGEA